MPARPARVNDRGQNTFRLTVRFGAVLTMNVTSRLLSAPAGVRTVNPTGQNGKDENGYGSFFSGFAPGMARNGLSGSSGNWKASATFVM